MRGFLQGIRRSPAWLYLKRDIRTWVGLALIVTIVGVAIFADFIAPFDPGERAGDPHVPPGGRFILGTDHIGRDVFSRLIYGSRSALMVGLLLVAVTSSIGITLGLIAGYYGGKVDGLIMRAVDIALSFPGLVLAAAFVGFFGTGLRNLIIALSLTGWAGFARVTRGQCLAIRREDYIEAAHAIGEKPRTIMFRYIFPNAVSPLIVMMTMTLPVAIILASAMSFLGLGVSPDEADWGAMLYQAQGPIKDGIWWPAFFPGLAIVITVLGFNFFGDALRDALDPRLRHGRRA
jgi:peptide/nickel transport system permease protein